MSTPLPGYQESIFSESHAHHLFLEFELSSITGPLPGREILETTTPRVYTTIACSGKVLDGIDHRLTPELLKPFKTIVSKSGASAPSKQRDLFIWIQSNQRDEVFAQGLLWTEVLKEHTAQLTEEHGFLFRDSRDLTGFIDGSANPKDDKRMEAALIPSGVHADGSFVLTQRWQHRLSDFNQLSVPEQEQVIGRTKKDSVELQGDEQPANSHVSRTDIQRDNNPVKIYRRSTPTGSVQKPGLFFLAFSAELKRFDWLLQSMFGNTEDGIQDHLLTYSKALAGSYYIAPNQQTLKRIFR